MSRPESTEPLHQKGANGLIAEYQCALRLVGLLEENRLSVRQTSRELTKLLRSQEAKYVGDLSPAQIQRAENQGTALGEYVFRELAASPQNLGLPPTLILKNCTVDVFPTGHETNKEGSSDIELVFHDDKTDKEDRLPISLKAYASSTTSLGSKSAIPSLGRLFLAKAKPTEAEFVAYFGPLGEEFCRLLRDFKSVAKEFYQDSAEGRAFVERYFARKGTRKVNNKLRRAELGDYFEKRRGFKSEHRFAELYAAMFRLGYERVVASAQWKEFLVGMHFLLGMENRILTLNAIAGDDGKVVKVENSLLSTVHGRLHRILKPGVVVELISTEESGTLRVVVRDAHDKIDSLTLSIWKDATIQYKLTT